MNIIANSCSPGKVLNPKTGKCVVENGRTHKKILQEAGVLQSKARQIVVTGSGTKQYVCGPGYIINPETGKCIKQDGDVAKKLHNKAIAGSLSPSVRHIVQKSLAKGNMNIPVSVSPKHCPEGKIINPVTKKCINMTGRTAKKILKESGVYVPSANCPEGKIYNQKTGKCVKISGRAGKTILKESGVQIVNQGMAAGLPIADPNAGKILNPFTNKWIIPGGRTANVMKKQMALQQLVSTIPHHISPKVVQRAVVHNSPCKPGFIRNPITGKCIIENGRTHKELLKKIAK